MSQPSDKPNHGGLRHETFLGRIEVGRGSSGSPDEAHGPDWHVMLDRASDDVAVLIGHLQGQGGSGDMQVLVQAVIVPVNKPESLPDFDALIDYSNSSGCVESMYDMARRSVDVQTALMDFTMNLPVKAPDVEIHKFERLPKENAEESPE